jgi:insulysin
MHSLTRFRALISVCTFTAALLVQPTYGFLEGLPQKASTDRSEYRHLVLDNGLRVILLSDPDLNKSSAAMAIDVGSLSDPKDRQGAAHFLEHMLFLGTEKYPGEGDYGNYIRSHGGFSNAYTAGDHTNYHFEINHDAFDGALDRFAQFFIAPLFTEEFTEREMNAVDSENEKNLENDLYRIDRVQRSYFNEDHPENHFSTGNLATLEGIRKEEFTGFYEKYYSANLMALALTGAAGLDELEILARKHFSSIENREEPPIVYPSKLLDSAPFVRFLQIEPIKDLRQLTMDFPLPATRHLFESKPARIVGFIFGYEGAGSLLSILKEAGLATGLGAGAYDPTADYSILSITVELTPKGLEQWEDVMKIVFSYVELMRRSPFPEFIFNERATMARLDELYQDKGEGNDRATTLANNALHYPLELAERIPYLYTKPDPDAYFGILDAIRPGTMIAALVAKGVPTDRKEQYYETNYSYSEIPGELYDALARPQIDPEMTFIQPNPFVPTKVELLAERPIKLIDEPGLALYYSQDTEFERPRVATVIKIRQPIRAATLRTVVLKAFYQATLKEMINEVTYAASEAGLDFSLDADLDGITLKISGYNESADRLMRFVVEKLTSIDLPQERFEAIKERMIRDLVNADRLDAFRQARETKRKVLRKVYFTPAEQLAIAESIILGDVRAFAPSLYSEGKIEALIHGNMTAEKAVASIEFVRDTLGIRPVAPDDLFEVELLRQAPGEVVTSIDRLMVNNSCLWSEYYLAPDSPENRAAALFINNFMEEPFYTEMRTRQQLGYIVWSFTFPQEDDLFGGFIIQSADYPADEIQKRVRAFLKTIPDLLAELPEDKFASIVAGARARVEEKDKSIAERALRFFLRAYEYDEDWERRRNTLEALDNLTREQVEETLVRMLSPETSRIRTVLAFARQHEPAADTVASYENVEKWKARQRFD